MSSSRNDRRELNCQQNYSPFDKTINNNTNNHLILVVDDTTVNLKLISDFLRTAGFDVRAAKSGFQAMQIIEKRKPDIILLDVMMPEMDGLETCRRLKESPETREIPVIFMTAVDDASDASYKVKGLAIGAVDYISKPVQLEEVLARIETHLRLRSLTQKIAQQKDLLSAVFNGSTDAIFLINPETGAIADCNQRAVNLFEANSKDELLNIQLDNWQTQSFSTEELRQILDDIDRQGFSSRELEYTTKQGKLFWGNLAVKQIYVAGQKLNLIRITDITDRKLTEAREREKSEQLKSALEELKRTQSQLIQTEKMSSLGRIVAGVAHEINNPISFIYGNISHAQQYFQELLKLIKIYQDKYPKPVLEIETLAEEIDFDFIVEDFSELMKSIQVGADRIRQIVVNLRNFSRLDEKEIKKVNIHEGIDNTLMILQHRLQAQGNRPKIQTITNYDDRLPLIKCYARDLNQVFLNILTNALDALESQLSDRLITISTCLVIKDFPATNSEFVAIRIADNGPGMNETVKQKIFDPFFTTKPIGSGMGLGLAIAHSIVVEKHKGAIDCISVLGQGTEFIIEIPVKLLVS
ncbi:MAG: hybrid sensor histidine kinase/response regulator [Microcoleus sp.]